MRVLWGVSILTVTLALVPAPAPAQSLGEAAAREKERREKEGKKPPTKSFTDSDLGTRAGSGTVSQPGSSTGAPEGAAASPVPGPEGEAKTEGQAEAKPQKSDDEIRAEREKAWRARRQAAQEQINKLTESIKMLSERLDDPMVSYNSHPRIRAQLDTAKQSRLEALEAMEKLDAEGREKGFRPE